VPAIVLVLLMVWIGVRPNDVLDRIRPSVDALQASVNARRSAAAARLEASAVSPPAAQRAAVAR
jgi:NADH:ubiquinone oxidoreductase subunit 4 (subunit M)